MMGRLSCRIGGGWELFCRTVKWGLIVASAGCKLCKWLLHNRHILSPATCRQPLRTITGKPFYQDILLILLMASIIIYDNLANM